VTPRAYRPVMDAAARRAAADANLVAAFDLCREHVADPRGATQKFGTVQAIRTGIEVPFFNPVLGVGVRADLDDVVAAVDWVETSGLPASVQLSDETHGRIGEAIAGQGFVELRFAEPLMVLEPIPPRPPVAPGVDIRTGGAELCDSLWAALGGRQLIRRLFNVSWASDPRVRLAVAIDNGQPVAAATAMRSGSCAGIYSVGTLEGARRRGLGRAVTWAAIGASVEAWGSEIAILTSTEMAVSLYRSIGFEQIGRVHIYERLADRP
jgi:hypothetical protein